MQSQTIDPTKSDRPESKGIAERAASALTRRDFLSLLWKSLLGISGLFGLGGVLRYMAYQPNPSPPTVFDLGLQDDFPVGTRTTIPEAEAVLLHTESGFKALSLVCPHLGCIVDPSNQGFACPCHGSRFGLEGELQHGPAASPLRELSLEFTEDGHLILHTA